MWSNGRQAVVTVHQNVDEGINDSGEGGWK